MAFELIIFGLASALVVVVILAKLIQTYNRIKYYENEVEYLEGKIKIPIQKKIDLIPQLIEAVEKNTNFERSTLREVAQMRSSWARSSTMTNASKISGAINALIYNVKERYPRLATSGDFQHVYRQMMSIENRIEKIRYSYNGQISNYNKAISFFPGSLAANLFGFKKKPFFGSEKKE
jgi:LemA protein